MRKENLEILGLWIGITLVSILAISGLVYWLKIFGIIG